MSTKELLQKLHACDDAITWCENKTLEQAWNTCERGDWLLWFSSRLSVDRKLVVKAACKCARLSLHLVPPDEKRPLQAIEVAEAWVDGKEILDNVKVTAAAAAATAAYATAATAAAAYAAAYAAAAAYATTAAAAAAATAAAAAYATAAADAAYATAAADAAYAVRIYTLAQCAIEVRTIISFKVIEEAVYAYH